MPGPKNGTTPDVPTIMNFPSFALTYDLATKDYIMSPRFSPDGTRLAFKAQPPGADAETPQLWAARRNMFAPPVISALTGYSVNHDAPYHDYAFAVGSTSTITV